MAIGHYLALHSTPDSLVVFNEQNPHRSLDLQIVMLTRYTLDLTLS
jgi:hypothetical protein